MTDFWLFFELGLSHVLDWRAYDHILFLVALCAAYNFGSWKRLLLLVTLFTVGHTLSLLLANYELVQVSSAWIEFLIPVTILAAAIYNVATAGKEKRLDTISIVYFITFFFGLIHGFGFATYFKMLAADGELFPLLEFAFGVEISQVVIALVVLTAEYVTQTFVRCSKRDWILVVSSIVIGMSIPMLMETWPF
ncbi:HupE/UreJ family protein [Ulvibacter litoralis]|uniref:HupE / UreJ protein n=1 Tax=Ulvibacter litoralis TaxID=227084 RepID=A0A1G7DM62_9FLAO|nr:HupE/UreJ family protein [Ulvibacter litoralis]GHC42960.1 hypothetical protein GCM10008083_01520 [Ulvibacter litoralis]SDE52569.1 HupE / UreJ protein [Ulvibacter litoralis]